MKKVEKRIQLLIILIGIGICIAFCCAGQTQSRQDSINSGMYPGKFQNLTPTEVLNQQMYIATLRDKVNKEIRKQQTIANKANQDWSFTHQGKFYDSKTEEQYKMLQQLLSQRDKEEYAETHAELLEVLAETKRLLAHYEQEQHPVVVQADPHIDGYTKTMNAWGMFFLGIAAGVLLITFINWLIKCCAIYRRM